MHGVMILRSTPTGASRGLAGAAELHAAFLREVADLLADDFGARAVVWDEGFASADGTPRAAAAGHDRDGLARHGHRPAGGAWPGMT